MSEAKPNLRILVADDDEHVLQLMRDFLKSMSVDVTAVKDGAEAVQAASTATFDLCVLDFEMPRMDGTQACEILRKSPKTAKIPILFLTSNTDSPSIYRALNAGASDYLAKPLVGRLLWHRINLLMRTEELAQENLRLRATLEIQQVKKAP